MSSSSAGSLSSTGLARASRPHLALPGLTMPTPCLVNRGQPCGQAGPPCALGPALLCCVTRGWGKGVPASSWASAPFSVPRDWGARGWETRWAMLSQGSYPDTPMGLRVHRSRTAGVSRPCNPETPASTGRHPQPAPTPTPCPQRRRPSSLRKPEFREGSRSSAS